MPAPYVTQLEKGGLAYVEFVKSNQGNNVRRVPNKNSPASILCSIPTGTAVEILDGPSPDAEMIWWKVRARQACRLGTDDEVDVTGWTSEGTAQERWLKPIGPIPVVRGRCRAKLGTRLAMGERALVLDPTGRGRPNNVRDKPDINGRLLGSIAAGASLRVLRGPRCAGGMVWWEVRSDGGRRLRGWTSEGMLGEGYYLLPLDVRKDRPVLAHAIGSAPMFQGDIRVEIKEGSRVVPAARTVAWSFSPDGQALSLFFSDLIAGSLRDDGRVVPAMSASVLLPINSATQAIVVKQTFLGTVSMDAQAHGRLEVQAGGPPESTRFPAGSDLPLDITTVSAGPIGPDYTLSTSLQVTRLSSGAQAGIWLDLIDLEVRPEKPVLQGFRG